MVDIQKAYRSIETVRVFVNHNVKAGFLKKDSSVDELLELIQQIQFNYLPMIESIAKMQDKIDWDWIIKLKEGVGLVSRVQGVRVIQEFDIEIGKRGIYEFDFEGVKKVVARKDDDIYAIVHLSDKPELMKVRGDVRDELFSALSK